MKTNPEKNRRPHISYYKNQEPPKKGELYTDPLFPPNINSLLELDNKGQPKDSEYDDFYSLFNEDQIEFVRPNEIFKNKKYKLFSEKIEMNDVIQGELGDCYFLSSVANLCKFPGLIKGLFKTEDINKDGFYEIMLRVDGKRQIVIVDDFLPVFKEDKKPCFAKPHGNELWVMLLEKAWAKVNGGYAYIESGYPSEALEALTGFGSLLYNTTLMKDDELNKNKPEIINNLKIADQSHCLISCGTTNVKDPEELENVGLFDGHAYTLISLTQIITNEGNYEYLFKIRNPYGEKEWNGDWSDKSNLWNERLKNQLNFKDKEDGIFFMNEKDFFKYFKQIEICYILYNSTSVKYTIEGEENLKNGSVFNIETENEGFLSVSVLRKNCRTNRELKDKTFPTHISIVKYTPKESNRLKTFSDYNGTYTSSETCTLNIKVTKGNYLIYVYINYENLEISQEKSIDVKIACSAKFNHAQMHYDERDKGFPLLQNIILQAELNKRNINPDLAEDCDFKSEQIGRNGIIAYIYYKSMPGSYIKLSIEPTNLIILSPYLGYISESKDNIDKIIPSGTYFVLLSLINERSSLYFLEPQKPYITNEKLKVEFDNNDIDLTFFTDINNDIKNEKVKKRKTKSIEKVQKEYYFDITDGIIDYKSFEEIEKNYYNYIRLLDEFSKSNKDPNLKWGIMKGEYVIYIGQFNNEKKEGIGLFINPNNIFAGEFKNDLQNGLGYTYNKEFQKLYRGNYVNGLPEGKLIKESEIDKDEEEIQKLEKKLSKKNSFNYDNGERYQGDFNNNKREGKGIYYYNNGNKYIGDWKNGLKEGKGILYYNNGNKYIGDFKNNLREGKGKIYFNDGQIYEVYMKLNQIEGKVKLYFKNGEIYEGDIKNQIKEGYGNYYYKDGRKYYGNWKNNKYNGKGILYSSKGDKIYEGDWNNGIREGKGTYYDKNGDIYDGDWKNNKFEGKGILYSNRGNKVYEGDWKNNKFDGIGTLYYNNGDKYEGDWKEDQREGKGKYFLNTGKLFYEGDWKNNKREGKGICYYNNGKYDGDWKNDLKEGKGIYYLENGYKVYEGDYKNDKKEGKGIFYYNNGRYEGDFKNDKKEGVGAFHYNNDNIETGFYSNDICVVKYKQIRIGKGIDKNEYKKIVICCKDTYLKKNGEQKIAEIAAEDIKKNLGGEWIVFICNVNSEPDFYISRVEGKDFMIFSLNNKKFVVSRIK